jgi:hypothetical protein
LRLILIIRLILAEPIRHCKWLCKIFIFSDKQKYEQTAERDGWLVSTAVPGFRLKSAWLWPATRPKAIDALKELTDAPPAR